MLLVKTIAVLQDNYIYVAHDTVSGETAVIDPALAPPVLALCDNLGWSITYILNTHHHADHVGGNLAIKAASACRIVGYAADRNRIPGINIAVQEGDTIALGECRAHIIATPGHTNAHIAYHFAADNILFCGDTLFSMGCGRLFEGTPEQMWQSLCKLRALPPQTQIYCAHEYTQKNGEFCLQHDPHNTALQNRMKQVRSLRKQGKATLPVTLADEKQTNIFLNCDAPELQKRLQRSHQSPVQIFAHLRTLKDAF